MSLAEFAAKDTTKTGTQCWLCGIPERAEAEEGYRSGVKKATITRWLKTLYPDEATDNKVGKHFQNHLGAS